MANRKLTDLNLITTIEKEDVLHIVDVSDTTQDLEGSSFKVTAQKIKEFAQEGIVTEINWGDIEGTLSNQTDLNTALNLKSDTIIVSNHISDTTNPHSVTKAQVGLGNANNTSDLDKPISTANQTALNTKLESSDIANFETTTQLNTRDTNNRARANHTGTQIASTISDFQSTVSANTDVSANTSARHSAVTVTDSSEIDFTLTGQDITASLVAGSIDESKLDASVNASLNLAESSLQGVVAGTNVTVDNTDPQNPIISATGGGGEWGDITGTLSNQTDLQTALDSRVPYTGATTDVDLGANNMTANAFIGDGSGLTGLPDSGQLIYDAIVAPTGGDYELLSEAIADGKKTIYIKKGEYTETELVTVPDDTRIVGESNTESVITFTGTDGNGIFRVSGSRITVENLKLVGAGDSRLISDFGGTKTDLVIKDCVMSNGGSSGRILYITGTNQKIINNSISSTSNANNSLDFSSSVNVLFSNNTYDVPISGNGSFLTCPNGSGLKILNNQFNHRFSEGIFINQHDALISGNTFIFTQQTTTFRRFGLISKDNVRITNNLFMFDGASSSSTHDWFLLNGANRCTISDNYVGHITGLARNNRSYVNLFSSTTNNNIITDNNFTTATSATSPVINAGTGNLITNNKNLPDNTNVPYTGATTNLDLGVHDITATQGNIKTELAIGTSSGKVIIGDITGNARGTGAIDIQKRTSATQVVSGDNSVGVGRENTISTLSQNSVVFGRGNTSTSSGTYSDYGANNNLALGINNTSSGSGYYGGNGENQTVGIGNTTSGSSYSGGLSSAFGRNNTVSGYNSFAFGNGNTVSSNKSITIGSFNTASGYRSSASGYQNEVSSEQAVAIGNRNYISGMFSIGAGIDIDVLSDNNTKVGTADKYFNLNSTGFSIDNANSLANIHATGDVLVTSTSSLGSELITNGTFTGGATGWTLGTGWEYFSNSVRKIIDGTGTLSQTPTIVAGKYYYLTFDYRDISVGTLDVSLGGSSVQQIKAPTSPFLTRTYKAVIKATTTGGLIFTPSNTARIRLDNVSVKEITGGDIKALGAVQSGVYTVATLPAVGNAGKRAFVSDANATTFASIVAGGGANGVPVYDDGTNWRIG